jgi:hypothetical protein
MDVADRLTLVPVPVPVPVTAVPLHISHRHT